jgi:uncharacterized membrane protein
VFGSFDGLPIHVLVAHATVIVTPIAAVLGLAFVRPAWRMALRWPLVVAAAVATVLTYVSRQSGELFKEALGEGLSKSAAAEVVERHEDLAGYLWIWVLVFLGVCIVAALVLPRLTNPLAGGAVAIIVAAVAVVVIVLVAYTGHQGSKAVWNPDGSIDYSGS